MLEYCLSEQRRLQATYSALGKERERRKRRRERELRLKEESKNCENTRIALQAKLAAIKRIQENRRNSIPGGGGNALKTPDRFLKRKESCEQPVTVYDITRRKLQERMKTIERKLKQTKWRKNLENGKNQFKQCQRRKLKRQRVKNKTTRILHDEDQDNGTRITIKLDGAAKFQPALEILDDLMNSHLAIPFCEPVDPVKYQISDYFLKIRKPMDLGTVRANVTKGKYKELWEVWADIRLVWENCRTYNGPSNPFTIKANALAQMFEARLERFSEITPRKSGRKRKLPRRLDGMLSSQQIGTSAGKIALREKISTLSPTRLERILTTLASRGKANKDKNGNYEIDFDTMGEDTASEVEELVSKEIKSYDENVREKKTGIKKTDVKKRLPTPNRRGRQTLSPTGSHWSSKLGNVPGRMEPFEMDNTDVFSSSSSSDEDCDIFKPREEDVSGTTSNAVTLSKSPIHPSNQTIKVEKSTVEDVTPLEKKDSCAKHSLNKATKNINHFKDSHLVD